ncbi:MAG: 30S ribosomal protein S16 [Pirellulales bacterium]|nr:30S ribosomal protein S16 [Pirellulales bacterium]
MAVKIRMKRLGRKNRPFYRICAVDSRRPRDGKVIEELGTYDPLVRETDARTTLNNERVKYWLGVGAQPSEAVGVLIKKYGENGTHVAAMQAARERIASGREVPPAPTPVVTAESRKKAEAAEAPAEAPAEAAEESAE